VVCDDIGDQRELRMMALRGRSVRIPRALDDAPACHQRQRRATSQYLFVAK